MFIRFMDQQRTKQNKKHRPMPVGQEVFAVLEMYNEKKNLASLVLECNELLLPYTHNIHILGPEWVKIVEKKKHYCIAVFFPFILSLQISYI